MRDRLQELANKKGLDNVEFELIAGTSGVFEIVRDGKLVYSKKALNRFPEDAEVDAIF